MANINCNLILGDRAVKRRDLLSAISSAVYRLKNSYPEPLAAVVPDVDKVSQRRRILLAEDSKDNRFLVESYLKMTSYEHEGVEVVYV